MELFENDGVGNLVPRDFPLKVGGTGKALGTRLWCRDNHMISLTEFFSNTNPKWPVIVAFLDHSSIVWTENIRFESATSVFKFILVWPKLIYFADRIVDELNPEANFTKQEIMKLICEKVCCAVNN